MRRYLEYKDSQSSKFWSIEVTDASFTVSYGKIGTGGQTQVKEFGSEEECLKQAEKLINEKTRKGYVEQDAQPKKSPQELQAMFEEKYKDVTAEDASGYYYSPHPNMNTVMDRVLREMQEGIEQAVKKHKKKQRNLFPRRQ